MHGNQRTASLPAPVNRGPSFRWEGGKTRNKLHFKGPCLAPFLVFKGHVVQTWTRHVAAGFVPAPPRWGRGHRRRTIEYVLTLLFISRFFGRAFKGRPNSTARPLLLATLKGLIHAEDRVFVKSLYNVLLRCCASFRTNSEILDGVRSANAALRNLPRFCVRTQSRVITPATQNKRVKNRRQNK